MGRNGNGHNVVELAPQSVEAEEAILGGVLIDNNMLIEASGIVEPGDFSREKNRWLFEAMLHLDKRESAIDFTTVVDELDRMGKLKQVGGPAYIAELIGSTFSSAHVPYYADIVYRTSVQRQLIQAGGQIAALAYKGDVDGAEELLAQAEQVLSNLGRQLRPKNVEVRDLLDKMMDEVWNPTGKVAQRIFTGFPGIDGPMLGIESGRFWAVAATPGSGKTAWALNIVRGVARTNRGGAAVLYFHPEQPEEEITRLLWCSGTENVPPIRLKALMTPKEQRGMFLKAAGFVERSTQARGKSTERVEYLMKDPEQAELEALAASRDELDGTPIILNDPSGQNIHQVVATIRRVRSKLPDDVFLLVVFDGAHLIPGTGEGSRYAELVTITRSLKIAAQNVVTAGGEAPGAVIANTQLNREIFSNINNRVYRMSYLRDSGCLAGDTLVYLPGTGERVPIRELEGRSGFSVLATDTETWKMEPRRVAACFTTGTKPVFRLMTGLGRTIRATANHKFLTVHGWKRLDQLDVGDYIAIVADRDVSWNPVVSIEPDGEQPVFDLSVEGLHNFVANDIVVHNSWEQDSDCILFLDRESVFKNGNGNGGWDPFSVIGKKNRQTSRLFTSFWQMHTSTMKVQGRDLV